jgi:hypothetical protein
VIGHGLPIGQRLESQPAGLRQHLLTFVGQPRLTNARFANQADHLSGATAHACPAVLQEVQFPRPALQGCLAPSQTSRSGEWLWLGEEILRDGPMSGPLFVGLTNAVGNADGTASPTNNGDPRARTGPGVLNVTLHMAGLACDGTTDGWPGPEDEVYIKVTLRRFLSGIWYKWGYDKNDRVWKEGNPDPRYVPDPALGQGDHWDMSEGSRIGNILLLPLAVGVNEAWEVTVSLLEDDDNRHLPDTVKTTIGSFAVTIENKDGQIKTTWSTQANVIDDVPPSRLPDGYKGSDNNHGFRMNGDGSNYYGWYTVK